MNQEKLKRDLVFIVMKPKDQNLEYLKVSLQVLYKGIGQEKYLQRLDINKVSQQFLTKLYKSFSKTEVGSNFIWSFLSFNMNEVYGRKTQFGNLIMINWLLSEKSIERWFNKPEMADYFTSQFLELFKISTPIFQKERVDIEDIEEVERERFLNTDQGFYHCKSFASYNRYSKSCQICKNKKLCIEPGNKQ